MMRQLEISLAVQAEIDNTWNTIDQEDWLLIEEKALELLEADLAAKTNLLSLPMLSEALPKYIGFEDAEIDRAVFEAAFWVLGRPAFRVHWSRLESRNTETFQHDDSIEDPLLRELRVPAACNDSPQRISRLQIALAWGRSSSESMNTAVEANEAVLSELEIHMAKPPSSPLPSSRPNAVRRRFNTLRTHAMP
jgi:hypothetical protein